MTNTHWVSIWTSAPAIAESKPARWAKNLSLRYVIHPLLDGEKIRVHLSNFGGTESVCISSVWAAPSRGEDRVDPEGCRQITFGGNRECRMNAGEDSVSDEIPFEVKRGQEIAVSIYLQDVTELASGTAASGPLTHAYYAEGNFAGEERFDPFYINATDMNFFLSGIDVLAGAEDHALACFGDSITSQAWPDYLALRLEREGIRHLSVNRLAISGSRVLRQYGYLQKRHYGPKGDARFEKEISAAGVKSVIIMHGINDIIHPDGSQFRPWEDLPTAEEMIEGFRFYVETAHRMGMKVYLGTIISIKEWRTYLPVREELRHRVNDWIRTQTEADGVIDFDRVTCDPKDPDARDPLCDSGDHLHPSLQGAQKMAECIPLDFLH